MEPTANCSRLSRTTTNMPLSTPSPIPPSGSRARISTKGHPSKLTPTASKVTLFRSSPSPRDSGPSNHATSWPSPTDSPSILKEEKPCPTPKSAPPNSQEIIVSSGWSSQLRTSRSFLPLPPPSPPMPIQTSLYPSHPPKQKWKQVSSPNPWTLPR